jgi:hypothetical protein
MPLAIPLTERGLVFHRTVMRTRNKNTTCFPFFTMFLMDENLVPLKEMYISATFIMEKTNSL